MRVTRFEEITFGAAYLVAAAFPFVRMWAGPIPVYLMDLLIVIPLVSLLLRNRRFDRLNLTVPVLLLMLLLLFNTVFMWIYTDELLAFVYRNGRRALSMTAFFLAGWICATNAERRARWIKLIVGGLLLHASMMVGQYVLGRFAYEVLVDLDNFYYNTLSSMPTPSRINLWGVAWYVPRAFGGYWNPNSAAAALLVPLPLIFLIRKHRYLIGISVLAFLALLLTGARQGAITAFIVTVIFVLRGQIYTGLSRIRAGGLLLGAAVGSIIIVSYFPAAVDRFFQPDEDETLSATTEARLDNYPEFFQYMFIEHPEQLLLGQGVDFVNVQAHIESSVEWSGGFVSNSWLLMIAQQGLLAFGVFMVFYWKLLLKANRFPAFQISLLALGVLALFDNHIAIYDSIQLIFWTIAGVTVSYASSDE